MDNIILPDPVIDTSYEVSDQVIVLNPRKKIIILPDNEFATAPDLQEVTDVGATTNNAVTITNLLTVDRFKLSDSPSNGYVMTSDSEGNATWQQLPDVTTPNLQQVTDVGATTNNFTIFLGGASSSNTSDTKYGFRAAENTTGNNYVAIGSDAARANTTGSGFVAIGDSALEVHPNALQVTVVGADAAKNQTSGFGNVVFGTSTATTAIGGSPTATNFGSSTYLGAGIQISANGVRNETVVGYFGQGRGSNTVTFGNQSITDVYTFGTFNTSNASPLASSPGGTDATAGYVLTADGSGNSSWQPGGGSGDTPTLQEVTEAGATTDQDVQFTGEIRTTNTNNEKLGDSALNNITTGTQNIAIGPSALASLETGTNNTAIGQQALLVNRASLNTAIGSDASRQNFNGSANTSIGYFALYNNVNGNDNVAIGVTAGQRQVGSQCTFIGRAAGEGAANDNFTNSTALGNRSVINSDNQVVLGNDAITTVDTSGTFNSSNTSPLGSSPSGTPATTGYVLTADGSGNSSWQPGGGGGQTPTLQEVTEAGATTTEDVELLGQITSTASGSSSEKFGVDALANDDGGTNANTAFGNLALTTVVNGSSNVAVGFRALTANTGSTNVGIGTASLFNVSTGNGNVGVGTNVGSSLRTGSNNVLLGTNAASSSVAPGFPTSLSDGVYIGARSESSTGNASNEIVIGASAEGVGDNTVTLGSSAITSVNTFGTYITSNASPLGSSPGGTPADAGYVLTADGAGNSSWQAGGGGSTPTLQDVTDAGNTTTTDVNLIGNVLTTGTNSTRIGGQAARNLLGTNTTCIAVGYRALATVTGGSQNVAIGQQAGEDILFGASNVLVGNGAGLNLSNNGNNVAVGTEALRGLSAGGGGQCTAVGYNALFQTNNNPGQNTALGYQAGRNNSTIQKCTFLGHTTDSTSQGLQNSTAIGYQAIVDSNNQCVIGNTDLTEILSQAAVKIERDPANSFGYRMMNRTSGDPMVAINCNNGIGTITAYNNDGSVGVFISGNGDVNAKGFLVDGTAGATGTFTAGGQTITVTNGIITDIS